MTKTLLATKLYIPPTRPELVSRPRLIERLNGGLHHKLTLISAPAGFGKTTLLVWFRKRFTEQRPLAKAMSGGAYATYVFYAPVIVLLAVALRGINLDMALKYVVVVPFAVGSAFLTGNLVKKLPVARNIL